MLSHVESLGNDNVRWLYKIRRYNNSPLSMTVNMAADLMKGFPLTNQHTCALSGAWSSVISLIPFAAGIAICQHM